MDGNEGAPEAPATEGPASAEGLRETIMQQLEAQGNLDSTSDTEGTGETTAVEPAPHTYKLSDGTEIPVDELEKGYLRQSDYTRKTQEVAQLRAEADQALRLMQALADNPMATLEALQRNLGVTDTEDLDPYEQQLLEHEQRFAQLEQQRFEAELDQTLTGLENQYADRGFDRDTVLAFAVEHEIPNLRAAFLAWEEDQQFEQARRQGNAQAAQARNSIPPLGGRSRQLGGEAPQFREVNSVADAMYNALAELESS